MSLRRTLGALVVSLATTLAFVSAVPSPASAAAPTVATGHASAAAATNQPSAADATDEPRRGRHGCSAAFFRSDRRLGPEVLSNSGLTGLELRRYHRTGGLSPARFLAKYWDPTLYDGSGGWIYPPQNGYRLDSQGDPIVWTSTLAVGRYVDRYGSEYGSFLAPTGAPYARRAIPPSNLVGTPAEQCNYYNYRVLKPLPVHVGPVAAWFEQPGGTLQYQLDGSLIAGAPASVNIIWLLDHGYLERVSPAA
ncbi:MAG: TNT domain-containing protein [Intrasporangium sp.]|uniref:TNT domain-containing protein n=1 Tax=Intrasporangium sp. TaxID=1925024 RepID=UPI0026488DF0|nr:TNT domain-containing protein [Intrasporangium sp.]MDN5795104.1 TNT domain-containing protein [Intrasporangium sp.]